MALVVAASACGASQPIEHTSPSSTLPQKKLQLSRAADAARPSADSGIASIYPAQTMHYSAVGSLPDLGADAPVWRMTAPPVDTNAVQRIADALGLAGKVGAEADGWTVQDGITSLHVNRSN